MTPSSPQDSAPVPALKGRRATLFYDGYCGLCHGLVAFVVRKDLAGIFDFAALQGEAAGRILPPLGCDPSAMNTVVVVDSAQRVYVKSAAAFYVLKRLGGVWSAVATLALLPRVLTDWGYDRIANNRYKIWGKRDTCPLPPPGTRNRFLP